MSIFNISGINSTTSETQLAALLSNFDSELIFTIIEDNINNRVENYYNKIPNIVSAYEYNFNQLIETYPFGVNEINENREETYVEIINILQQYFNFEVNRFNISNIDTATIASVLYAFFVCDFKDIIIKFFTNYIIKEYNNLYNCLQLDRFKKEKDADTLYNKKIYKNPKMGLIAANIDYVGSNIQVFDIDFETFLKFSVPVKQYGDLLLAIIIPRGDFFKDVIVSSFNKNNNIRSLLLMDIKTNIQSLSITNNINIIETIQ